MCLGPIFAFARTLDVLHTMHIWVKHAFAESNGQLVAVTQISACLKLVALD